VLCTRSSGIYKPNPYFLAFVVSEISDGHGLIDSASDPDEEYIYFMVYDESSIPFYSTSNGYKNLL